MGQPNVGSAPAASAVPPSPTTPRLVPVAIAWAVVVAVVGGVLTAQLMLHLNASFIGTVLLWGVGAVGGFVSRKITAAASPLAGYCLVAACVLSMCIADVVWHHGAVTIPDPVTRERRDPTWQESVQRVPKYLMNEKQATLLLGVICTIFGAQSAYWQAGKRYRLVAVAE